MEGNAGAGRSNRLTATVLVMLWLTIIFDGYDLIVYGSVVPSLLQDPDWSLTPTQAGAIGSYALIGMLFGALSVGVLADRIGRKKTILLTLAWFSLAMGLSAIAPTPEILGVSRFLAGLGLGGVIPSVNALIIEYAPPKRRTFVHGLMLTGYPLGGIVAAGVAIPLIPAFGWRSVFWIGMIPLFVVVPLAAKFLPESLEWLLAKGRNEEAEAIARRYGVRLRPAAAQAQEGGGTPVRTAMPTGIFSGRFAAASVFFPVAFALNLLTAYGLVTWLPTIMREAGYSLGSALSFLLVLNLAAVFAIPLAGAAADRFGSKPVCAVAFLSASVGIVLLVLDPPMSVTYVLIGLAGFGTLGTQAQLSAYVAKYYPVSNRATALGWSVGVGRFGAMAGPLLGGLLISSQLGLQWNFYAFALLSLVGFVAILLVPSPPVDTSPRAFAEADAARA